MKDTELLERIADLYNYVQSVRNALGQIDQAIARLSIDLKCDVCTGDGITADETGWVKCPSCNGIGKVKS